MAPRASDSYNLALLFPEIVEEWHPTKNIKKPSEYAPYSGKKVWWICEREHEWKTRIADRTQKGSGCPKCRPGTSRLEIRLYCELKTIFEDIKWRIKLDGIECDIYLPKYKLGVRAQLSLNTHVSFYELNNSINRIIRKKFVYDDLNIMKYTLNSLNSMLSYNIKKKPNGYTKNINEINNNISLIYDNISCDFSLDLIKIVLSYVPVSSDSKSIVDAFFRLVDCLEDNEFNTLKYSIGMGLFSIDHKLAQTHSKFIREKLIDYILGEDPKLKSRAKQLDEMKSHWLSKGLR